MTFSAFFHIGLCGAVGERWAHTRQIRVRFPATSKEFVHLVLLMWPLLADILNEFWGHDHVVKFIIKIEIWKNVLFCYDFFLDQFSLLMYTFWLASRLFLRIIVWISSFKCNLVIAVLFKRFGCVGKPFWYVFV